MLAYNLKKLMLNTGLSSKKLSNILNMNRSTLIKILNGTTPNPRIETIHTLASYFKVSAHELLEESNIIFETISTPKIKEIILSLMKYNGINSPKELSKQSGVPYSVIEDIMLEKTTAPNIATLKKFADFFSISVTQLLRLEKHIAPTTKLISEIANIPVFASNIIKDFTLNYNEILTPINHIKAFRKDNANNVFAILITEDNLLPDFSRNELLFIDSKETVRINDFVLARVNNNTNIFECINTGQNFIYLKPAGAFEAKKFNKENIEMIGVITQKVFNSNLNYG